MGILTSGLVCILVFAGFAVGMNFVLHEKYVGYIILIAFLPIARGVVGVFPICGSLIGFRARP